MIVMVDVPAFFTCRELVNFVRPAVPKISLMKILRDGIIHNTNFYYFLIKFRNAK